jgi:HEAT repeat protein
VPVSNSIQTLADRLAAEVAAYGEDPPRARTVLGELLAADAPGFCRAAVPLLKEGQVRAGVHFLYTLLTDVLPLCNPALATLEDDVVVARVLMEKEPLLDVKLARRISNSMVLGNQPLDSTVTLRILEVLAAIADGSRILPVLIQVLRQPDPRLRSKAALLVGRTNKSAQWVEQFLWEPDARVRANSVEALWGEETGPVRAVFLAAMKDRNNRVLGNALLGLHRLGDASAIRSILQMATHAAPAFRATAAWTMGQTGDPRFLHCLAQMVGETNSVARRNVFRAIARLNKAVSGRAQAPALRVALGQTSSLPDGMRLVRAGVAQLDGCDLEGLRPTEVALWQGQRLIADYALRKLQPADWLSLGVALPARQTGSEAQVEILESGVLACLAVKREADRWAILRSCQPPEGAPGGEPEPAAPPACALLQCNPALIEALNAPENRFALADGIQALLGVIAQAGGSRHLLLLEDCTAGTVRQELLPERWQLAIAEAKAAEVAIHAVALVDPGGSSGILAEVAALTGGLCLTTSEPAKFAALCEKLYFVLLHPCELLYRPGEPEPDGPLKLQVYPPQGRGEDVLNG